MRSVDVILAESWRRDPEGHQPDLHLTNLIQRDGRPQGSLQNSQAVLLDFAPQALQRIFQPCDDGALLLQVGGEVIQLQVGVRHRNAPMAWGFTYSRACV